MLAAADVRSVSSQEGVMRDFSNNFQVSRRLRLNEMIHYHPRGFDNFTTGRQAFRDSMKIAQILASVELNSSSSLFNSSSISFIKNKCADQLDAEDANCVSRRVDNIEPSLRGSREPWVESSKILTRSRPKASKTSSQVLRNFVCWPSSLILNRVTSLAF